MNTGLRIKLKLGIQITRITHSFITVNSRTDEKRLVQVTLGNVK
jgi:hypothetical protein